MSIIDEIFNPILGKPAWNVRRGLGSFLTFEFGDPHLEIREPRKAKPGASVKSQRRMARRLVMIHGEWHLWIMHAEWKAFNQEELIGDSDSSKRILEKVASEFDGQALMRVTVTGQTHTSFEFDLGGRLEVFPDPPDVDDNDEWLLYEPTGKVFALRTDGYYSHESGRKQLVPEDWFPLCP